MNVKELLTRKVLAIPVFVFLIAGSVGFAAVLVTTLTTRTSTVNEPFTASIIDDLKDLYPGESDTVTVRIWNAAPNSLYVKVTPEVVIEEGSEITADEITVSDPICESVPASGYYDADFDVSVSPDAHTGSFHLDFDVERVATCSE